MPWCFSQLASSPLTVWELVLDILGCVINLVDCRPMALVQSAAAWAAMAAPSTSLHVVDPKGPSPSKVGMASLVRNESVAAHKLPRRQRIARGHLLPKRANSGIHDQTLLKADTRSQSMQQHLCNLSCLSKHVTNSESWACTYMQILTFPTKQS